MNCPTDDGSTWTHFCWQNNIAWNRRYSAIGSLHWIKTMGVSAWHCIRMNIYILDTHNRIFGYRQCVYHQLLSCSCVCVSTFALWNNNRKIVDAKHQIKRTETGKIKIIFHYRMVFVVMRIGAACYAGHSLFSLDYRMHCDGGNSTGLLSKRHGHVSPNSVEYVTNNSWIFIWSLCACGGGSRCFGNENSLLFFVYQ